MKQLLTLLAAATVGTTISPLTLNIAAINNTPTPNYITLMGKELYSGSSVRMSDTTAIVSSGRNQYYFFDSTKVNTSSKGLINLNKNGRFFRLSDTIAIFIDSSYQVYLFNSTNVNNSSKGFTNLTQNYYSFHRLSDTTGIFYNPEKIKNWFFDLTTMTFTNLNIESYEFYFLSETSAILRTFTDETYLFDSTKIDEANKGLFKFEAKPEDKFEANYSFKRYVRMSDTTAIFWNSFGEAIWFDSTQVNNSSKGLTDLGQRVYQFYRLSDTTAIMSDLITDEMLYFDFNKLDDASHGFRNLEKKLTGFYSLSETTGLFIEMRPYKGNFNTYFFDDTKLDDASHGFTLIKNEAIVLVNRLSDTLAIFGIDSGSVTSVVPYSSVLFDATKVNDASHGCLIIKTMSDFVSLTDTTGIFATAIINNHRSTFYFEYK